MKTLHLAVMLTVFLFTTCTQQQKETEKWYVSIGYASYCIVDSEDPCLMYWGVDTKEENFRKMVKYANYVLQQKKVTNEPVTLKSEENSLEFRVEFENLSDSTYSDFFRISVKDTDFQDTYITIDLMGSLIYSDGRRHRVSKDITGYETFMPSELSGSLYRHPGDQRQNTEGIYLGSDTDSYILNRLWYLTAVCFGELDEKMQVESVSKNPK